jgi:acyl carrier protein
MPVQLRQNVPAAALAPVIPVTTAPQPAAAEKAVKPEPAKVPTNGSNGNGKPVDVKPPEKAVVVTPAAPSTDFASELLKIVSDKTGYPQEMLDLNMDMEADLGIDSIKRVEILGALQLVMPDLPKPEPEGLAEMRTLQHIIDYLGAGIPAAPAAAASTTPVEAPRPATGAQAAPNAVPASQAVSGEALTETLLNVVSEKTGYPKEMLDLNMNMEADLGIDSIKRVEILGALQQEYPDLPKPEPEALAELATLAQIIAFLQAGSAPAPAAILAAMTVVEQKTVPEAKAQPVAPAPGPAAAIPVASGDLKEAVLQVVSEKTGYPQEMLDLGMNMEADLGIDSIKRVEILGALQAKYPDLPKPDPESLAEMCTLGNIIDFLGKPVEAVASTETPRPFA